MITAKIFRNNQNQVYGFRVDNHGESFVCAAVSVLVLNTVNSIERFTDERFILDCVEEGGYIELELPRLHCGCTNSDVTLLLNSLVLGLNGISDEYSDEIQVIDEGGIT